MLMTLLLIVAVTAALRSLWSPCGLSMLSTLTPLSERSRGHRYSLTATWFVFGAVLGGAALAVPVAFVAWVSPELGSRAALVVFAVVALTAAAADVRLFGLALPNHPRQVDETWLGRYRRWIYAAGFGVQIGSGVATYVMTAGVYLLIVGAVLTSSWSAAVLCCVAFGLTRGLLVLVAARCDTPARLQAVHRFLDRHADTSVTAMAVVLLAVAVGAAADVGPVWCVIAALPAAGVLIARWSAVRSTNARQDAPTPVNDLTIA